MKFPYDLHFKCSLSFGLPRKNMSLAPLCTMFLQCQPLPDYNNTFYRKFAAHRVPHFHGAHRECIISIALFAFECCIFSFSLLAGHNGNVLIVVAAAAFIVIYCQKCQLHNREHIRAASANMNGSIGHFFVWCKLE